MRLIFWLAVAVILYAYAGYPLALAILTRRSRVTWRDETFLPPVSLVIAAHNEEKVLREKLENTLGLDYPRDRLEIVVASDGSTDATNAIVRGYANRGVLLHEIIPRGGKTRALNLAVPRTRGSILLLSDANTMFRRDAVRKLVRHFADPTVGAVSGDVRLVNSADSYARSEGLYYRYERWLQRLESRLESIVGADGGMYAVRRDLFRPPPSSIVLDDFVISMTVARLGFRVLYEPDAVAIEQGTQTSREEFRRKVRIVAGGIQALKLRQGIPGLRQPLLLWCYLSHKLLRWWMPCFLLIGLLASASLAQDAFYRFALWGQVLFYGAAALYAVNARGFRRLRWIGIPYYFCLVNGAALAGLWKGLIGAQRVTWTPTTR